MQSILSVIGVLQVAIVVLGVMIWREMRAGRTLQIHLPDNLRIVGPVEDQPPHTTLGHNAMIEHHSSAEEPAPVFSPIASTLLLIDRDGVVKHECTIHRKEVPAFHTYGGTSYQRVGQRSEHVYEYTEVV